MSYDTTLADRVRRVLAKRTDVSEKPMFGGLAFMLRDKMCCGVIQQDLVVRLGPARYEEALWEPHVRAMDFTGKPLTGYVYVAPAGVATPEALEKWVGAGTDFVTTLLAAPPPARRSSKRPPAPSPVFRPPASPPARVAAAKGPGATKDAARKPSAKKTAPKKAAAKTASKKTVASKKAAKTKTAPKKAAKKKTAKSKRSR